MFAASVSVPLVGQVLRVTAGHLTPHVFLRRGDSCVRGKGSANAACASVRKMKRDVTPADIVRSVR